MYATNYFEAMVLGTLRGQRAEAPERLYLALFLTSPGEGGDEGVEVAYPEYARQPVAFSQPAPLGGGIGVVNEADVSFPTASVAVGAVTHIGVMDSPAGGNMLLYGAFDDNAAVDVGEAPVLVAGEAQWWMTGNMSDAFRTRVLRLLRGQSMDGFAAHLALYGGDPEDGGAELYGEGYARVAVPFAAPSEQPGGQMLLASSAAVSMPRAGGPWGTWTHTVLFDAASGGMPVFATARAVPKETRKSMQVMLAEGKLTLSLH